MQHLEKVRFLLQDTYQRIHVLDNNFHELSNKSVQKVEILIANRGRAVGRVT